MALLRAARAAAPLLAPLAARGPPRAAAGAPALLRRLCWADAQQQPQPRAPGPPPASHTTGTGSPEFAQRHGFSVLPDYEDVVAEEPVQPLQPAEDFFRVVVPAAAPRCRAVPDAAIRVTRGRHFSADTGSAAMRLDRTASKAVVHVHFRELPQPLSPAQDAALRGLCGPRYHPGSQVLKLTADELPTADENEALCMERLGKIVDAAELPSL